MTKRIYFALIIALGLCSTAAAQQRLSERTFLTTDRHVYVTGDRIWCSAFCVDAADAGRLSTFSSIAYVELHSAEGLAQTSRIALLGGRGAGCIQLRSDLPTGNYKLVAYTATNLNEPDFDYSKNATTISIFNPSGSKRVKGGTSITDTPLCEEALPDAIGQVEVVAPDETSLRVIPVSIKNNGRSAASFSVSVYHDDGLAAPQSQTISGFAASLAPGTRFEQVRTPEFDGEIVRAKVAGLDPRKTEAIHGLFAFISAPGDMADVYSSPITPDGTATFYTNNIFGDKDLVCDIENLPEDISCHLEIVSPFADVNVGDIPQLAINKQAASQLEARKVSAIIEKSFSADTLYQNLPIRANHVFGAEGKSYILDDYTRFPDMSDVLIEILPELRARKHGGKVTISMRLNDVYNAVRYSDDESLMLVDGTPVFDHSKIMQYDPALVQTINVYPYRYFIGSRCYSGVTDFVTFKKNLPQMNFDEDVRIVSFQGAALPMAYTCAGAASTCEYPDYRQTAYWHPLMKAGAGETATVECTLPEYSGRFIIVVEGLSEDGKPFRSVKAVVSEQKAQ